MVRCPNPSAIACPSGELIAHGSKIVLHGSAYVSTHTERPAVQAHRNLGHLSKSIANRPVMGSENERVILSAEGSPRRIGIA